MKATFEMIIALSKVFLAHCPSKAASANTTARIGNGFVASHVWRKLTNNGSASQHPLTYSFIPNLVWLPTQVAKLTVVC